MDDPIDAFARLNRLRSQGILTDAEYEREKATLMGELGPSDSGPGQRWADAWKATGDMRRSLRWSFLASVIVIALIGAYFFGKARTLAEARGELGASDVLRPEAVSGQVPERNALNPMEATARSESPARLAAEADVTIEGTAGRFSSSQQKLIDAWSELEETCRGGAGDESITAQACEDRDVALDRMNAKGVCYGKEGQFDAEFEVHLCAPGSIGNQPASQRRNTANGM